MTPQYEPSNWLYASYTEYIHIYIMYHINTNGPSHLCHYVICTSGLHLEFPIWGPYWPIPWRAGSLCCALHDELVSIITPSYIVASPSFLCPTRHIWHMGHRDRRQTQTECGDPAVPRSGCRRDTQCQRVGHPLRAVMIMFVQTVW